MFHCNVCSTLLSNSFHQHLLLCLHTNEPIHLCTNLVVVTQWGEYKIREAISSSEEVLSEKTSMVEMPAYGSCPASLLRRHDPAAAGVGRRKPGRRWGWPPARICSHLGGNAAAAGQLPPSTCRCPPRLVVALLGRPILRRRGDGAGVYGGGRTSVATRGGVLVGTGL